MPARLKSADQTLQLGHRAKFSLDLSIAGNRVATIVGTSRRLEQGHQVQVVDAQVLKVGEALLEAGKVAGEQIHVAHGTNGLVTQVPGSRLAMLDIGPAQGSAAVRKSRAGGEDNGFDTGGKVHPLTVEPLQDIDKPG